MEVKNIILHPVTLTTFLMTFKINLKAEMGIVELNCAWPLTKPDLQNLKSSQPCH